MQVYIYGDLPPKFEPAFAALSKRLGFVQEKNGLEVQVLREGTGLAVQRCKERATIRYSKPVQLYRALSLLKQHWNQQDFLIEETPCFETLGIMFDVSRNAVLTMDALKTMLEKMALMGMDLGMMYTEDTYEIPEQPYFGWNRGRYSIQELKELDDYADQFGIELCPCIQTLGHLNRALHWPALAHLKDNEEVLLADVEETYTFLEQAIKAAVAPYRSKRIHIGMDEAHGVGLGAHLRRFGYENPHQIIRRHLDRVRQMTKNLGLDAMMWSDMYFRPDSPTNGYYDSGEPSAESLSSAFDDVTLVYWDYYHSDKATYDEMFRKHKQFKAPVAFASGIWTWAGPATDYQKTVESVIPGLQSAKDAGIPLVLATAWGDNGAEANLQTALLGMQMFAEFNYTGTYCPTATAQRFAVCCNGDFDMFFQLSDFNTVPGMKHMDDHPVNAAKFLLYQDPLVQLYQDDTKGLEMAKHYQALAQTYANYAKQAGEYQLLFEFYHQLAKVLAQKCQWHQEICPAVANQDKAKAKELALALQDLQQDVEALRICWRELWNSTNKPFGFEVLDGRLGAIRARLDTASTRVLNWVNGGCVPVELLEPALPYTRQKDGSLFGSYAVGEIVSACKIDI